MRNALLTTALLAICTAGAQTVSPTTNANNPVANPDAYQIGEGSATVNQTVQLYLPKATALHLDTTTIKFDLNDLNSGSATMTCVYAANGDDGKPFLDDDKLQLNDNFYNQVQVLPLGTEYELSADSWPNINVVGGGPVTSYPPIKIGTNGELVANSKNHFVCYKSFLLQKFSNGGKWDLTVSRSDADPSKSIEHLYIQDNPCDTAGAPTGLYALGNGQSTHLVPLDLQTGPTGTRSAAAAERCGYKSWLDDLVVLAVKVNGDNWGQSTANLTYTLTTTDWSNGTDGTSK